MLVPVGLVPVDPEVVPVPVLEPADVLGAPVRLVPLVPALPVPVLPLIPPVMPVTPLPLAPEPPLPTDAFTAPLPAADEVAPAVTRCLRTFGRRVCVERFTVADGLAPWADTPLVP